MVFKWCGGNSLEQGGKKDLNIHQEVVAFFPRTCKETQNCATINRSCSGWWLPPMLMPYLQYGLDFQLHCQVRIQTGFVVLAQATATDQHTSPTPFRDPWALVAVLASQAVCGSVPVPPCAAEEAINHSWCGTINLCGEREQVG